MKIARASLVVLVVLTGAAYRSIALDRLPGINGDEAYYPVAATNIRDGRPQPLISGSGLPLNPLYTGLVYLLHIRHPTPSVTLARLPALISGLLALALMYPLVVRVADRETAVYATLLLASLPAAIAYSRFGWDQSQAPLIALLCIFCALRNWPLRLAVTYVFALWIHPVNVFLAPILLGPIAARDIATWQDRANVFTIRNVAAAVGVTAVSIGLVVWFSATIRAAAAPLLGRALDVAGWWRYVVALGDLLAGVTIYRFIAGEPPTAWIVLERVVFWTLALFLLARVLPRWLRSKDVVRLGLLGGSFVAVLAFYLLMGPGALSPGWERYGFWIVSPACLVLGLLVSSLGASAAARSAQYVGISATCVFLLVGFYRNYFAVLETSGGNTAAAFRTGPVEPKKAAFDAIVAMASDERLPITVVAEDWWTYYPLRYLATERQTIDVVWPGGSSGAHSEGERRHRFAVGFDDGPFDRWAERHTPALDRQTIVDSAGRPVLYVWDLASRADVQEALVDAARNAERR